MSDGNAMNTTASTGKTDKSVFYIALVAVFAVVVWGLVAPRHFGKTADAAFAFLVNTFGWFCLLAMVLLVIFAVGNGFSKWVNMHQGPVGSESGFR